MGLRVRDTRNHTRAIAETREMHVQVETFARILAMKWLQFPLIQGLHGISGCGVQPVFNNEHSDELSSCQGNAKGDYS